MANSTLTKDELIQKRVELEAETATLQEEVAARTYDVDFESVANITAVLKQIDKAYTWNIKNAALVINLYDNLKAAKTELTKTEATEFVVGLNQININTLYQVLTSIEGVGIESAKTFAKLLTNIGAQITTAINAVQESNQEIQANHVALAELDAAIEAASKETVEADEISE